MANPEHVEILEKGVEAWNRWRSENPKIIPDLSGNFYDEAYLPDINFIRVNLSGANLFRAILLDAKFDFADLSNTVMSASIFERARFFRTNLINANLVEATMVKALFEGALLSGTEFYRAIIGWTIFSDLDFSEAKGLDTIEHNGPSRISIDTIYKSGGQIPQIFLRGCGVPENFITYMKSLTMNPIEYYSCFISYSHKDKPFARRLHDQLQARGIRCWLDEKQLLPGDDMHDMIDRGIRHWDKVLLCCSETSLNSWWVDKEMDRAINKEERLWKERGKKVLSLIPLNLDGYLFGGWEGGKKDMVTTRLAADFTGWETDNSKFEEQFELVVRALQTEGAREEPPVSKL